MKIMIIINERKSFKFQNKGIYSYCYVVNVLKIKIYKFRE